MNFTPPPDVDSMVTWRMSGHKVASTVDVSKGKSCRHAMIAIVAQGCSGLVEQGRYASGYVPKGYYGPCFI